MSTLYTCEPMNIFDRTEAHAERIVVGWSKSEGLYGPDAQALRDVMRRGWVSFGSYPRWPVPAPKTIESLEDFALVLGDSWALPPELLPHYPQEEKPDAPPGLCF